MSNTNATTPPEVEESKGIGSVDLLAALSEVYKEIKICYDEEDGYFLRYGKEPRIDWWELMETNEHLGTRRKTLDEAIRAAVEWHNGDLMDAHEWRKPIEIPANHSGL